MVSLVSPSTILYTCMSSHIFLIRYDEVFDKKSTFIEVKKVLVCLYDALSVALSVVMHATVTKYKTISRMVGHPEICSVTYRALGHLHLIAKCPQGIDKNHYYYNVVFTKDSYRNPIEKIYQAQWWANFSGRGPHQ